MPESITTSAIADSVTVQVVEKHPLWIRWAHWVNFPLLTLMIWSGLRIYWAHQAYQPLFFPDWFYTYLNLGRHLADGMAMHFAVMWLFAINGLAYAVYMLISGEWRALAPDRRAWRDAPLVALHDFGLRPHLPPQGKFNAAQRITYSAIIVMGAGSLVTGVAIYRPSQLYWLTAILGGYEAARLWHFALTIGYCLFFVVHIAQVIRAGWNNFRAMLAGFEETRRE